MVKMQNSKPFFALLAVGLLTVFSSVILLYFTSIANHQSFLSEQTWSISKAVDSVAEYDAAFNSDYEDGGAKAATLSQLLGARLEALGFGETGEMVLGERRGDEIHFLMPSRFLGEEIGPVDFLAQTAEPMKRALLGQSGVITAQDHQGDLVLASHTPIPSLGIGLVAKISMREILAPYIPAALWGIGVVIGSTLLCYLFHSFILLRLLHNRAAKNETRFGVNAGFGVMLGLTSYIIFVGVCSALAVIIYIYPISVEKQQSQLASLGASFSAFVDSVARFDSTRANVQTSGSSEQATLAQLRSAAIQLVNFGDTGEYVFGQIQGDNIEFLFPSRFTGVAPAPVPRDGVNAESLRRALQGQSGVIEDIDYRGVEVLAAFYPINELSLGLVVKTDLDEFNRPYFLAATTVTGITFILVIIGIFLTSQFLVAPQAAASSQKAVSTSGAVLSDSLTLPPGVMLGLIVLCALFIFVIDYLSPLGVAMGIPYIALVIAGAWLPRNRDVIYLAILSTVLILLGILISPPNPENMSAAIANRIYALLVVWLAAIVVLSIQNAKTALQQRQRASLLDSAPDATLLVDSAGEIVLVNAQTRKLFGYENDELVGQKIEKLIPDRLHESHIGHRDHFLSSPAVRSMGATGNLMSVHKSGREFSVEISLSPIESENEQLVAASVRDVSVRKRMEEDLRDAKDAAEAGAKAKSNFLSAMSHEIRTPMNGVVGMIDLFRETTLDDDQQQMIETVRNSAYSLLTIINDILDFSKIEAGKLDLEEIPISIVDAVEGVAEALAVTARDKNIQLCVYVDPGIPDGVIGDQVRLRQIIFNLGGNGIKFTERGKVLIRADRLASDDDTQVLIRLQIIDEGIGIPQEAQKSLFKAFSQVDASTTRRYGGTGLGLSICQRLTELMGGEIGVESVEGEGSTFHVTLSFPIAEEHSFKGDGEDLEGLNILLAFEEPELLALIPNYLQHWDARTECVEQLLGIKEAALAAVTEGDPFDVVVLGSSGSLEEQIGLIEELSTDDRLSLKYVVACRQRSRKARKQLDNTIYIDADPMQRGALVRGVAAAVGRASPDVEYENHAIPKNPGKAPTVEEAAAMGQLILLAEDNLTNQDVIRRQLNVLGYAVEIANDGVEALAYLEKSSYAMLLTDCHMPNMDGFELTKTIRKSESNSPIHLPIVAITASVMKEEIDNCFSFGMDDYLPKPIEMDKLRSMLHKRMPEAINSSRSTAQYPSSEERTQTEVEGVTSSGNGAIDPLVLKNDFDEETILEILREFVEPTSSTAEEIRVAFAERSAAGVAKAAHKLKSSSSTVGASVLADLCQRLEEAGYEENWDIIDREAPLLFSAVEEAIDYINSL